MLSLQKLLWVIFMDFGTDLAIERKIMADSSLPEGVEQYTRGDKMSPVTEIRISGEAGEKALGKPRGRYITVEVPSFSADCELFDGRLDILADEIRSLLPSDGTVLTVGLGNRDMTADALGPLFADSVFATRLKNNQFLHKNMVRQGTFPHLTIVILMISPITFFQED